MKLTAAQRQALEWLRDGERWWPAKVTMDALERKGLVDIPSSFRATWWDASLTDAGRRALEEAG